MDVRAPSFRRATCGAHWWTKTLRFSAARQHEAALAPIQEAVGIRRELVAQHPDTYQPDLAANVQNLGIVQAKLGKREEALQSMQEAVDVWRKLSEQHRDAFWQDFARGLSNLSNVHKPQHRNLIWSYGRP